MNKKLVSFSRIYCCWLLFTVWLEQDFHTTKEEKNLYKDTPIRNFDMNNALKDWQLEIFW